MRLRIGGIAIIFMLQGCASIPPIDYEGVNTELSPLLPEPTHKALTETPSLSAEERHARLSALLDRPLHTQPTIKPGETFVYEFPLMQYGTYMYHPHADELVQMALGLMGMFIIHPREPENQIIQRDYALLLHNWAVHPGTYRPDPNVLQDFDLWTMNSKVFPFIDSLVAQTDERVRIRVGNLSMWNHPMHLHGVQFQVTGSDGGRWPGHQWRSEATEIIGVGQTRDIEFVARPGDWASIATWCTTP